MYQNIPQQNNSNYYQSPYSPQYQRLAQLESQQQYQQNQYFTPQQSQPQQFAQQTPSTANFLKGRPVVSLDEARASQIDLDGSLHVFTDIGNKKIYTKQINLDGTATLNTYSLTEKVAPTESYVTKTEFEQAIKTIMENFNSNKSLEEKGKEKITNGSKPIIETRKPVSK